jgi:hypothetical protein
MYGKLEKIGKKGVVSSFQALSEHLVGMIKGLRLKFKAKFQTKGLDNVSTTVKTKV